MPIILIDLDSTVFDFASHFDNWAHRNGYDNFNKGVLGKITYAISDAFDGEVDELEIVGKFFACDETMSSFPPLVGSQKPIQRLHSAGYDFVGITAVTPLEGMSERRNDNFEAAFGFRCEEIYCVGLRGSKEHHLSMYQPTIWVEDSVEHAKTGSRLGHKSFLINYPYNAGEGDFTRVDGWDEIERYICAEN